MLLAHTITSTLTRSARLAFAIAVLQVQIHPVPNYCSGSDSRYEFKIRTQKIYNTKYGTG